MHASDLAIAAAKPILSQVDPQSIDVVIYFGSPHKDYHVWSSPQKFSMNLD